MSLGSAEASLGAMITNFTQDSDEEAVVPVVLPEASDAEGEPTDSVDRLAQMIQSFVQEPEEGVQPAEINGASPGARQLLTDLYNKFPNKPAWVKRPSIPSKPDFSSVKDKFTVSTENRQRVEAIVANISRDQMKEQVDSLLNSMNKNVPVQTQRLTTATTIAKIALKMYVKREAKNLTIDAISTTLSVGSHAIPLVPAAIAFGVDAYKVKQGGLAKLYESSAQHTGSALSPFELKASDKELEKNKFDGKRSAPKKIIRKIGVLMNGLRSGITQSVIGLTRARHKVSKELTSLGVDTLLTEDQLTDKLLAANLSSKDVIKLGKTLARLRSMGHYGDIDVYGDEGSDIYSVKKEHNPDMMEMLHVALNKLVNDNKITTLSNITSENEAFIEQWNEEYDDIERKKKDKATKLFAVSGSALATFATAFGVSEIFSKLVKIDADDHQESVDAIVSTNADIDMDQLLEDLNTGKLPEPSVLESFTKTEYANGSISYNVDGEGNYDFLITSNGSIKTLVGNTIKTVYNPLEG